MKEQVDLIVRETGEVVTVGGGGAGPRRGVDMDALEVVPQGALAVRDGLIVAVDEEHAISSRFEAELELSAEGGTVLPGFCDPHTHPVFATTREGEFDLRSRGGTYQDITRAGGGIFSSVRALRASPAAELRKKLADRLDRFVLCGTTSLEAKSGYGLTPETELLALELLGEAHDSHVIDIDRTCLAAHQVPPEFAQDRDAYIQLVNEKILPEVAQRKLARSADVFCDEGAYTVDEARRVLEAARSLGLAIRVHADELAPVGASELAASMGAQTADHLVHISEQGIAALLAAGTTPVLLPGTCFSLRLKDYAPARSMIEAGLPVALATDFNPGTSFVPSMVEIIALACGLLGLTVAEAVTAATRNSAETLGLPGVRGRLEVGAVADLVVLDMPNHLFLGYQLGWNPVQAVVKSGAVVWRRHASRPALL
jgi:imidazolonepropionase